MKIMMSAEDNVEAQNQGPMPTLRVRITHGPEDLYVGKIGYLFDFNSPEFQSYILTVTETEVRRLHLHEGYQYQVEEI
jgi:hypothetical protein